MVHLHFCRNRVCYASHSLAAGHHLIKYWPKAKNQASCQRKPVRGRGWIQLFNFLMISGKLFLSLGCHYFMTWGKSCCFFWRSHIKVWKQTSHWRHRGHVREIWKLWKENAHPMIPEYPSIHCLQIKETKNAQLLQRRETF